MIYTLVSVGLRRDGVDGRNPIAQKGVNKCDKNPYRRPRLPCTSLPPTCTFTQPLLPQGVPACFVHSCQKSHKMERTQQRGFEALPNEVLPIHAGSP
jgi:hypothetical protein